VWQSIIVAIEQYAEAAAGNREFVLNKGPTRGEATFRDRLAQAGSLKKSSGLLTQC
jgi:hypothetical protein